MRGIASYPDLLRRTGHLLALILCSVAISPAIAQQVTLSLGSGSATPGSAVALGLSMTASGASPTGVQWSLNYPSDVTGVTVVPSLAVTAAGISVSCMGSAGSTNCILYGLTASAIPTGSVATATFTISAATINPSISVALSGMVATSALGNSIPISGTGGTIAVVQSPPVLSGLSCSPTSVNAPGSSACTATLSKAAPAGGFAVALASNNTNASVPASITVSAGALTAGFTVTVASVPADQTAVVTASASGVSKTVSLSLLASSQLSSLSCTPSALGTGQATVCTVTLTKAATGSATVSLSSSSSLLPAPASMTISSGLSSGTFTATAGIVSADSSATLTATFAGQSRTSSVALSAQALLSGLTCAPTSVIGPATASCTVTLTKPASSGGMPIGLSSNNANVTVPASVTVPAASSSAGFTATAAAVTTDQAAALAAIANGVTKSFSLSLLAQRRSASGTISPASSGSAVTVSMTGGSTSSVTTDASGNFTFTGLLNGTYQLTPSKTGTLFSPSSKSITVNGADVAGIAFTATQNQTQTYATPVVDAQVWKDQAKASSWVTSPSLSTSTGNELILAFIATDGGTRRTLNTIVNSVSGGGLSWVLVARTSVQSGTSEIWRAFSPAPLNHVSVTASLSLSVTSSMTVLSFSGVDTAGSNGSGAIGATGTGNNRSGTPKATLVTTRNNSVVIGVGEDPTKAVARTLGSGQGLVHQYLAATGNTYWVQSLIAPTAQSGSSATVYDSAPTKDAYNLSIVEVLGAPIAAGSQFSVQTTGMSRRSSPALASGAARNLSTAPTLSSLASDSASEMCSPGGLVTLKGSDFTNQEAQRATSYPLPTELAGARVTVNSEAMPLLFASNSQINFQCPALPEGSALEIAVEGGSGPVALPISATMQAAAPDVFTLGGTNQGIIQITGTNELAIEQTEGIPSRPARPGESVTVYASGLGETQDPVSVGVPAPLDRAVVSRNKVEVVFGDAGAVSGVATLVPGTVGLFQIEVRTPLDASTGLAVPLSVRVTLPDGRVVDSNAVTIAIATETSR